MYLSTVVPVYNEESRIQDSLRKIRTFMCKYAPSYEIIIVDDGSTDGTLNAIDELCGNDPSVRILSYPQNRGKGHAVRYGLANSNGSYRLFSDADLSTPIEEVEALIHWIEQGFDVSIASRSVEDSQVLRHQPLHREIMGKVFNRIVRLSLGLPFSDTQCGFKCMTASAAKKILPLLRVDGFGFDVELLFVAKHLGLTVREVGAQWRNSPATKVGLVGDPIKMLGAIPKIYLNLLRGYYTPESN